MSTTLADNAEDQALELEALESIYPTELSLHPTTNKASTKAFSILLTPDEQQLHEQDEGLFSESEVEIVLRLNVLHFVVMYNRDYPSRRLPDLAITAKLNLASLLTSENLPTQPPSVPDSLYLSSTDLSTLRTFMNSEAVNLHTETSSSVIVFPLASAIRSKMTELIVLRHTQAYEKKVAKLKEEEDIVHAKKQGTRVTVASFMEWKNAFEKEMKQQEKRQVLSLMNSQATTSEKKSNSQGQKLTGKQLWERNEVTLAMDDMVADDEVDVDYELIEKELEGMGIDQEDGDVAAILAAEELETE